MKRSGIKRKTPLQSKSYLKRSTPLKRGNSVLTTSTLRRSSTPISSKGLRGHGRKQSDIALHSRLASLGCFPCRVLGIQTISPVRIHHPNGRSRGKDGDYKEAFVFCACDLHHTNTPPIGIIFDPNTPSVHCGNKRKFKQLVGSEEWAVLESYQLLQEKPCWLSAEQWKDYQSCCSKEGQEQWITDVGRRSLCA